MSSELAVPADLTPSQRTHFWLLNEDTGEVYSLGPMYGRSDADLDYTKRKLELEKLPYRWVLLSPAALPSGEKQPQ